MKNRKRNRLFLLLILLLGVTVGFALLSTTLKINGNASIAKNTWSVYWANVGNQTGVTPTTAPGITSEDEEHQNNILSFGVTLDKPGDFYEFQVDAVNDGTIDAMLSVITTNITSNGSPATLPSYIKYSVIYADDEEPVKKHLLAKDTTERYKIRIEFLKSITNDELNNMPEEGLEYDIDVEVPYVQADDTATNRHAHNFQLGEYFTLVPDKTIATTTTPGFSGSTPTADQTLWRVININEDGTVEAVSDSASSGEITVSGVDGYKYYVAGLQDIASCYAKEGYTVATRMMGYDGQTPVIQDASAFDGTSNNAPDTSSTPSSADVSVGEEYMGGVLGDTLCLKDYNLVENVYGSVEASPAKEYLLAARYYYYYSDNEFSFHGVCITCLDNYYSRYNNGRWYEYSSSYAVRPIITLRKGITIASGTGIKNDPYIFN